MGFIISLAHFVGWIILVPALIYLSVSLIMTLYAAIFGRDAADMFPEDAEWYVFRVGFKNFWLWLAGFCVSFVLFLCTRNLRKKGYSLEEIANEFPNISLDDAERIERFLSFHYWYPFNGILE